MTKNILAKIISTLTWILFYSWLILLGIEAIKSGLVSNYYDLNQHFLLFIIVFMISLLLPSESKKANFFSWPDVIVLAIIVLLVIVFFLLQFGFSLYALIFSLLLIIITVLVFYTVKSIE